MLYLRRISVFSMVLLLVFTISTAFGEYSFTNDADAIEEAANSVFMLEVYSGRNQKIGIGSGFLAFDHTKLVTNYHVIENGAYVIAVSDDQDQYYITKIIASDKEMDIAILQFDQYIEATPLELVGSANLKRSQPVVAIGSPAGLMNTISMGNISRFYQKDGHDWIQFTAPISSGSSGGALLNDQGKVIGITTATYASTQNINMAVKAENVIRLYENAKGHTSTDINKTTGTNSPGIVRPESNTTGESTTVYVTPGGKKYHNNPGCSKMKSPLKMDLMDAIEKGYEPCGKCYK